MQSLWTYKVSGLFKGCGRLALVNSLINESVVQVSVRFLLMNGSPAVERSFSRFERDENSFINTG